MQRTARKDLSLKQPLMTLHGHSLVTSHDTSLSVSSTTHAIVTIAVISSERHRTKIFVNSCYTSKVMSLTRSLAAKENLLRIIRAAFVTGRMPLLSSS